MTAHLNRSDILNAPEPDVNTYPVCTFGVCGDTDKVPATHLMPQIVSIDGGARNVTYKWVLVCTHHAMDWWDDDEPPGNPDGFRLVPMNTTVREQP